ncbi:glycosyltransferase family 4 protein [candidate division WWE3 bacterium]|nr:glycosyltransferase family 4 protein [candidate division WWE3 bacterium]
MKIAINGQILLTTTFSPTGPYVYTENLVKTLAKIDNTNRYVIYLSDEFPRFGKFEDLTLGNPNFEIKIVKKRTSWTQLDLLLTLWKDKPDVFFTAVHTIPVLAIPWLKTIAMIHGLEYSFSPISKTWKRYFQALPIWFTAFFASKIIVPSTATRNAILQRFYFINPKKLFVVPEGINPIFTPRSKEEIKDIRAKYNLGDSDYLFFISSIQPRKNVPNMVGGFAKALKELSVQPKLVLSGKLAWLYDESVNSPHKYGVEDKVVFLGPAPTSDLPALASGAYGFVNLSFEEGFGLPLLEAMSCGVPCVVSNIPAYREIDLGNFIFVDPHDQNSIKQGILKLFTEPEGAREKRINDGFNNVARFSWVETASKTLQIIVN